jgi:hypothetical protein
MNYKQFKQSLDYIRELYDLDRGYEKVMSKIDPDNYPSFIFNKPIDYLTTVLEMAMGDNNKDSTISYYMHEIDWGKKGKNCIIDKNGKKISLCTDRQVYDYLTVDSKLSTIN